MPAAPDVRVKITEDYARHVGKDAYFWAWPMVNMYNRRLFNRAHIYSLKTKKHLDFVESLIFRKGAIFRATKSISITAFIFALSEALADTFGNRFIEFL